MGIVKDLLYKASNKSFLDKVKAQTIFPYYHLVNDVAPAHVRHLYKFKNFAQFSQDLDVLCANYNPLDPGELLSGTIPENSFLLTFDDGLKEVYTIIYPELKRRNLKAIFFLNPDFIDNHKGLYKHYISIVIDELEKRNYEEKSLKRISAALSIEYSSIEDFKQKMISIKFSDKEKVDEILEMLGVDIKNYLKEQTPYISRREILEMLDNGFYFGGHTMSHPPLKQLPHEEQKAEIIDSIEWLKNNFGIKYSFFAFPFMDRGISKRLIEELFEYDRNILLFGNAGIKKDINPRIIQRFSVERPDKQFEKVIVTENLYKLFNKAIFQYKIRRS